jgi:DNA replication licensing factor MCM5
MSGWDEGAVYYSDQAQFPESGTDAAAATPSRHTILRKFKEFIRNLETDKNVFPYRESLINNPKSLLVHLEDLLAFDAELPSLLRSSPSDYLPLVGAFMNYVENTRCCICEIYEVSFFV